VKHNGYADSIYVAHCFDHLSIAENTLGLNRAAHRRPGSRADQRGDLNRAKWSKLATDIDQTLIASTAKVGRDYSFSGHRVLGYWRGNRSGVQIVPPPPDAPRATSEIAEHPFILEFPTRASSFLQITYYRRLVEHRRFSLLLNTLLSPRINTQSHRATHCWVVDHGNVTNDKWIDRIERAIVWCLQWFTERFTNAGTIKWLQQFFFANLDRVVNDVLSTATGDRLEELEPNDYYTNVHGYDGKALRVPSDLDSIYHYIDLSPEHREKFDRAAFWLDLASRQWTTSMSASFASLVTAIESLTEGRGDTHEFDCPICEKKGQHEVPGATQRFKAFFDAYAPGAALAKRRDKMYSLQSDILHGAKLMELDRTLAIGMSPRQSTEDDLNRELWGLTRVAVRNWLKSPT
jgi:hypothetical protein